MRMTGAQLAQAEVALQDVGIIRTSAWTPGGAYEYQASGLLGATRVVVRASGLLAANTPSSNRAYCAVSDADSNTIMYWTEGYAWHIVLI